MSEASTSHDTVAAEADQSVRAHLTCIDCGYDLHALPRSGKCPECSLEVSVSMNQHRHDHTWLTATRAGVVAMIFGYCVLLTTIILLPLLPLGLCFFIFLQMGAAMELEPKATVTDRSLSDFPARFIGISIMGYVCALVLTMASVEIAAITLVLAIAIHLAGTVLIWMAFLTQLNPVLPPRTRRIARGALLLHYSSAAAIVFLILAVPALVLLDLRSAAHSLALIGIPLAGITLIATLITSLYPLQNANVLLHNAAEAIGPENSPDPVEPTPDRDR